DPSFNRCEAPCSVGALTSRANPFDRFPESHSGNNRHSSSLASSPSTRSPRNSSRSLSIPSAFWRCDRCVSARSSRSGLANRCPRRFSSSSRSSSVIASRSSLSLGLVVPDARWFARAFPFETSNTLSISRCFSTSWAVAVEKLLRVPSRSLLRLRRRLLLRVLAALLAPALQRIRHRCALRERVRSVRFLVQLLQ